MAYEPKNGDGTLFINDKGDNPARPDRTGYVTAPCDLRAGDKIQLAGWLKDGAKGKFLSLRASVKEEERKTPERIPESDLDDKIPF